MNAKIAIDLDGTAWKYREEFKILISMLKMGGASVGILTAHINLEIPDLNLWKARGFPEIDFYFSKHPGEEGFPIEQWKIEQCKKYGINFLFDDFDSDTIRLVII